MQQQIEIIFMEWSVRIDNWHPIRTNQLLSVHWAKRSALKNRDKSIISGIVFNKQIPPAEIKRQVELTIGLGYRQRGGDPDAYTKSLADALVANKLLKDDRKEWVEFLPVKYERSTSGIYSILRIIEL